MLCWATQAGGGNLPPGAGNDAKIWGRVLFPRRPSPESGIGRSTRNARHSGARRDTTADGPQEVGGGCMSATPSDFAGRAGQRGARRLETWLDAGIGTSGQAQVAGPAIDHGFPIARWLPGKNNQVFAPF